MTSRGYQQGNICVIAESGGEIAYLSWIRFTDASMHKDRIEVPLRPHEAYIDAVYAMPAYRGRGLAAAVSTARFRYLRARGITTVYGWVSPRNIPMIRVLKRVGYRMVGQVTLFIWRLGCRVPLVNIIVITDPSDSPAGVCSPDRLRPRGGLTIYRDRTAA